MKMKKLLYILITFIFTFASCSEQIEVPDSIPADCIMLNVLNSPMTKAVEYPSGEDYEKTLKRLDCFFYVKGQTDQPCVYYQKIDLSKVGSAEIPCYVDESVINTIFPNGNTTCDVFVIANLPEGTFASKAQGTDVNTLDKILLQLGQGYDAVGQNFLMAGLDEATKVGDNNATGTILLYRAAAKITVSVNIPAEITFEYENGETVSMTPVLTDDTGEVTLKTAFHNGVRKTYLRDSYIDQIVDQDFFYTEKKSYTSVPTTEATAGAPAKYLYTCEVPFYSYAREWDKGADNAPYLTLDLPWKNETTGQYQTYYYQILINAAGREFRPNSWYDLTVNVGVLGSKIEAEPLLIKNTTYYVLDWTTEPDEEHEGGGDRYEDVEIQKYTYLVVPETRLEINNANSGVLRFDASHKLGIMMNTASKEVENLVNRRTNLASFYINCGGANGSAPTINDLQLSTEKIFEVDESRGILTFLHNIPDNVYSPIYVYATIWLERDGVPGMSLSEQEFSKEITIVQYPPLYIIPDQSVEHSVFVNGYYDSSTTIRYNNGKYVLGQARGEGDGDYMYTITVSSFNADDKFEYYNGEYINYIIGDPRQRIADTNLNDDNFDMTQTWVKDGDQQGLNYYYPTSSQDNAYRVVSPKFKVASFLGGYSSGCTPEGAAMRCASYQEHGYPAGRWRLPTTAEIMFVISLQQKDRIQDIFYGTNSYYSSTDLVRNSNTTTISPITENSTGSVRCVYDEWYWGTEREAVVNNMYPGGYEFTWGDKQIW